MIIFFSILRKVIKSIKPIQKVELVNIDNNSQANSTKSLPVICGQLKTSSVISVAYGFYPNYGFQTVVSVFKLVFIT